MRRAIFLLPLLAFAALAGMFLAATGHDPSVLPSALEGSGAPDFDLPAVEGLDLPGLKSRDLKGPAILNFFSSWCVPCRAEQPLLVEMAGRGAAIHGILYKDKPEPAQRFLVQAGNPFRRIGDDDDGRVALEFGVYGVPESFFIDKDGRIVGRVAGPLDPAEAEKWLKGQGL